MLTGMFHCRKKNAKQKKMNKKTSLYRAFTSPENSEREKSLLPKILTQDDP